jgi:hypothetical protein
MFHSSDLANDIDIKINIKEEIKLPNELIYDGKDLPDDKKITNSIFNKEQVKYNILIINNIFFFY